MLIVVLHLSSHSICMLMCSETVIRSKAIRAPLTVITVRAKVESNVQKQILYLTHENKVMKKKVITMIKAICLSSFFTDRLLTTHTSSEAPAAFFSLCRERLRRQHQHLILTASLNVSLTLKLSDFKAKGKRGSCAQIQVPYG